MADIMEIVISFQVLKENDYVYHENYTKYKDDIAVLWVREQ